MPVLPIPVVGASYKHRSEQLSDQRTLNLYPEYNEEAKEVISLQPTPGSVAFSAASGVDRGIGMHNGELYQVLDGSLYRISGSGARTLQVAIPGSGRCLLRSEGDVLVIVSNDGNAHTWNGTTLSTGTTNFESPTSMAYLNDQFIYPGSGQKFWVADAGQPLSVNIANFAYAYSSPDDLIRPYDFNQRIYMMGQDTIEPWYNSGQGNPPVDRINGGLMTVGLGAKYSVAHNDNFLYFIGDDKTAYRIVGSNAQRISDVSFANALEKMSQVSDAIGFCYTLQNQNFYQVNFPAANQTWCYHESTGKWFEMSTDDVRHLANDYVFVYGKHLVSDYRDGSIKELKLDAYDDAGTAIKRERSTAVIDASYFGSLGRGREVEMDWFELIMEVGVGIASGQGSDPKIIMQYSDDRGKTWSSELWTGVGDLPVGEMGSYKTRVRWGELGTFYQRLIRIRMSDPVLFSIHGAFAEMRLCID